MYSFAEGHKYVLLLTLVWDPLKAADQAIKIASGEFSTPEQHCRVENKRDPNAHSGLSKLPLTRVADLYTARLQGGKGGKLCLL